MLDLVIPTPLKRMVTTTMGMNGCSMRIGIDLGGTKIEALAMDASGRELARKRIATPRGDYAATVAAIAALVRELEPSAGQARVGVGIPGTVSPQTGRIKNANSTWIIGQSLQEDLSQALGRSVHLANDADCFAISEATDGAGAQAATVFGVILGTGCGGGLVVGGKLLKGPNAIAGEWGHNPLPWRTAEETPGPACYCGKHGCIETFVSGTGFAGDYRLASGSNLRGPAIVEAAERGDSLAEVSLQRYENRLARALASVINIVDPEVIVLGGGMSHVARLYRNVPPLLPRWVFGSEVSTVLRPPRHGDASGVRGAAWL